MSDNIPVAIVPEEVDYFNMPDLQDDLLEDLQRLECKVADATAVLSSAKYFKEDPERLFAIIKRAYWLLNR